jgi:thiol:disulfide interchange protein DsbA
MRFMKWLAGALMLGVVALASATPADPKNGVEYRTLAQQQPVEAGKKIEVWSSSITPARTAMLSIRT